MDYAATELRDKKMPLLRRLERKVKVDLEKKEMEEEALYGGFFNGNGNNKKNKPKKNFTKLHLYNKRRGRR